MKTMKQFLFIAVCTLTLMSCGRKIPSDFDYGTVKNNIYNNDFFGFTMDIPEEWFVQDEASKKMISEETEQSMDNEKLSKMIKASEVTSANLLMVTQFDLATHADPSVINSNFTLTAENLGMASVTIKDGNDYLEASKKQFVRNNVPIVVNEQTETMDIDGKTFHYFDGVLTTQGIKINQRYLATIANGFGLIYVATYGTEDQLEKLMDVLKSTDFR